MKPASAKAKGRQLQQWVRDRLTETFQWEEGDCESRSMGAAGVDVMLSPRAKRDFPFSLECKNTKTNPSLAALLQAEANSYPGTEAAVVWKPKGKAYTDTLITLRLETFLRLWRSINEARSRH